MQETNSRSGSGKNASGQKPQVSGALREKILEYVIARRQRLDYEQVVAMAKVREDQLEVELWNMMEANGFSSVKTEDGGTIIKTFKRIFNITNFHSFKEWALQSRNFDLLREEASKRELNNYCFEKIKAGEAESIPPGVELVVNKTIQVRGERGIVDV